MSVLHDAAYLTRVLGKSERWWKRNAAKFPHHKMGRTYCWDDDDIAEIRRLTAVRPVGFNAVDAVDMRPITGSRRSA